MRDPGLAAHAAADTPAHPALDGGVDRVAEREPPDQLVDDVVGEVPAVAAVQEVADALGRARGGVGDRLGSDCPSGGGIRGMLAAGDRALEAPRFVVGRKGRFNGHRWRLLRSSSAPYTL